MEAKKINLGCGRKNLDGYINVDYFQIKNHRDEDLVDLILDLEEEKLPYEDESIDLIRADNLLEHIGNLKHLMNECHRVLKKGKGLVGNVPIAGSKKDFQDPTHKRHFIKETFSYFTGKALWNEEKPSHPRYADYGFLPYEGLIMRIQDDLIYFKLIK